MTRPAMNSDHPGETPTPTEEELRQQRAAQAEALCQNWTIARVSMDAQTTRLRDVERRVEQVAVQPESDEREQMLVGLWEPRAMPQVAAACQRIIALVDPNAPKVINPGVVPSTNWANTLERVRICLSQANNIGLDIWNESTRAKPQLPPENLSQLGEQFLRLAEGLVVVLAVLPEVKQAQASTPKAPAEPKGWRAVLKRRFGGS